MKGIVFNLLEECVRAAHGDNAWDALLDAAELDGAYTSLGSYPDDHLGRLVAAAASVQGVPENEILRWFGRGAIPRLAEKYPAFFRPHDSTLPFLLTLNKIIHAEVRKLYPGAQVPVFEFETRPNQELVVEYRSSRGLCALAVGMIEGAARQFGEQVTLSHPRCRQQGEDACIFHVTFAPSVG